MKDQGGSRQFEVVVCCEGFGYCRHLQDEEGLQVGVSDVTGRDQQELVGPAEE